MVLKIFSWILKRYEINRKWFILWTGLGCLYYSFEFFFKFFRFEINLLIFNIFFWNVYVIRKFFLFFIKIIFNYINCVIYMLFFDDWNIIIIVLKGIFYWFNFGN